MHVISHIAEVRTRTAPPDDDRRNDAVFTSRDTYPIIPRFSATESIVLYFSLSNLRTGSYEAAYSSPKQSHDYLPLTPHPCSPSWHQCRRRMRAWTQLLSWARWFKSPKRQLRRPTPALLSSRATTSHMLWPALVEDSCQWLSRAHLQAVSR